MSMSIWDFEKPLVAMMLSHDHIAALEQQIKDLAAHLLEIKQLITPMMEFKTPTKVFGPNLEQVLNAAGFYRKKEWVGLTGAEVNHILAENVGYLERMMKEVEALLKEKNGG